MTPCSVPVAEYRFACATCDQEAGLVQLWRSGGAGHLIRDGFPSHLTLRVAPEVFERVRTMVLAGDVQALHAFDVEVASFYCPGCHVCYCRNHWTPWDVFEDEEDVLWHDSVRGRCPLGHERMVED